jgi:TonB family protein
MSRIALLESERHPNPSRSPAMTAASMALHLAVVAFAIAATSRSRTGGKPDEPAVIPIVRWLATHAPELPSAPKLQAPTPAVVQQHPLLPLLAVPSVIPAVPSVTPPAGATALPTAAATPAGTALPGTDSSVAGTGGPPFTGDDVDVPAAMLGGQQGPVYPEPLQRMGIAGRVLARFVVGTNGRVEGDPTILSATNAGFAQSVERYLASARYRPAVRNGQVVRQVAEQEFLFQVR